MQPIAPINLQTGHAGPVGNSFLPSAKIDIVKNSAGNYSRRPARPNTDREHYVIHCEARDVGRVYRRQLPEGHRYYWTIYINGHVHQVPGMPISGLAVTVDEASAAFKRSYEAMRLKAGLPKPQR